MPPLRALLCPLVILLLAACAAMPSPFPILGPLSDDETLQILEARTGSLRSLYAELEMTYEDADRGGTFEAVVHFQAPRQLRMTAFKDVALSVRHVFDLILTPTRYALELEDDGDGPPVVERGEASRFAGENPRFSGFYWLGEALWLPGGRSADRPARVVTRHAKEILVEAWLPTGARVIWELDAETLEVRRGRVEAPGDQRYELTCSRYRLVEGRFFPGRVVLRDLVSRTRVEARLQELVVDPELAPDLFDPDSIGS